MIRDIEKSFARCFSTADGAAVLKHLRGITIERCLGALATDAELRALEGRRALVHQIETLMQRGAGNAGQT
jgi:hypothetical protein